jgi:hypothetical protein
MTGINGKVIATIGGQPYTWAAAIARCGEILDGRLIPPDPQVLHLLAATVEFAFTHQVAPTDASEARILEKARTSYAGAWGLRGDGQPAGLPRPKVVTPLDETLAAAQAKAATLLTAWEGAQRGLKATRPESDARQEAEFVAARAQESYQAAARRVLKLEQQRSRWTAAHGAGV